MKTKMTDRKDALTKKPIAADETESGLSSRRDFLLTTAGGAAAAVIASCAGGGAGSDGGDDGLGGGDTEINNDTSGGGPAAANRVVRVIDSGATSWDGDDPSDFYQYAIPDAVDAMVSRGVQTLTGESTEEAAWRALVPYNEGELVVVHLNAYANNQNNAKNNVAATVSAVIYGLVDVLGIPADKIAVTDPSVRLTNSPAQARIIDGCRYADSLSWDMYQGINGPIIPFTDGQGPSSDEYIAQVIDEADHVILMPVLSWHGGNWITGALKMLMGAISNMGALHNALPVEMRESPVFADIGMVFKDKLRLIVADGLFGNIDGNSNPPHTFETLGGQGGTKPSSTLYFSKDMVAIDSVMYDDLLDEAKAQGRPKNEYKYGYLTFAADADHKLGTFEMRDETGAATYSKIDLVEVDLT
jgi:uncharacterized protein (DUF362 family)